MNRFDSLRALVSLVPCVTALALGTHAVAQVPAAAPHAAAPATSQTPAPAAALAACAFSACGKRCRPRFAIAFKLASAVAAWRHGGQAG
jgi:hypothetical protein